MSISQQIYLACIAALFIWRGGTYAFWVLLGNQVAILAACLAFDFHLLTRENLTVTEALIDFATAPIMFHKAGLPRLISVGYAIVLPIYALNIWFGLAEDTTFALVVSVGFLQVAVAGIGAGSDGGSGFHRRHMLRRNRLVLSRGDMGMGEGGLAQSRVDVSPDRRGP